MVYFPTRFTFDRYVRLWTQSGYPVLVMNSLIVTSVTVLICLLTGTIASYAFARFSFPGRTQLMLGYLVVRMFPAVLMIIPLFIVMRNVGLLDRTWGLAVAYTSFLLPLVRLDAEGLLRCRTQGARERGPHRWLDPHRRDAAHRHPDCPQRARRHLRLRRHRRMERVSVRPDADDEPGLAHLAGRPAADGRASSSCPGACWPPAA